MGHVRVCFPAVLFTRECHVTLNAVEQTCEYMVVKYGLIVVLVAETYMRVLACLPQFIPKLDSKERITTV